MAARSDRLANLLRRLGGRRGDRLLLMQPNVAPLWESVLACMKLGVVLVPPPPSSAGRISPTG
jgi:acetyl-CoA synthetase